MQFGRKDGGLLRAEALRSLREGVVTIRHFPHRPEAGIANSFVGRGSARTVGSKVCPKSAPSTAILYGSRPLRNDTSFQSALRNSPVARCAGGKGISHDLLRVCGR